MGGKTAMTTSLSYADRIDKLIIVDTSPTTSKSKGEVFAYMQQMIKMDMTKMKTRKDIDDDLKVVAKVLIFLRHRNCTSVCWF